MATSSIGDSGVNYQQWLEATTTPLNAGATFTSTTYKHSGWARVIGIIETDQAGSLIIDQSTDGGANFDYSTPVAVAANTAAGYSVELVTQAFQVRMLNSSGSNQTFLRLSIAVRAI